MRGLLQSRVAVQPRPSNDPLVRTCSLADMPRCFSHMRMLLKGQQIFAIHRVEPLQLYNNIDHGHLFRLHLLGRKRRTTQAILDWPS